jgi:hypothetical protein
MLGGKGTLVLIWERKVSMFDFNLEAIGGKRSQNFREEKIHLNKEPDKL